MKGVRGPDGHTGATGATGDHAQLIRRRVARQVPGFPGQVDTGGPGGHTAPPGAPPGARPGEVGNPRYTFTGVTGPTGDTGATLPVGPAGTRGPISPPGGNTGVMEPRGCPGTSDVIISI